MDELVKVAIFMVLFGILLPTFDTYSDGYFSYSLISGTYCETSICVKHPIYGSVMLIPVLLAMLFTIPHWWRREKRWNRLYTLPLLICQVWPQWQVIKVLKLMKDGNSQWRIEKEKLEKEVGSLEPFLESIPQVHLILLIVGTGIGGRFGIYNSSLQCSLTFSLSVISACFGMSKFFNVGPARLIPYDKMNLGFFVLMVNIASCFIGKGFFLAFIEEGSPSLRTIIICIIWSLLSLVPQMIFAFVTMWTSLGFRKALRTATQYPAMIMTPAFSYWVFGPIESSLKSTFCCSRTSRLGVSFLHTWINAGVTILGQIIFSLLCKPIYLLLGFRLPPILNFVCFSLGFHIISVLTLALIQLLERCDKVSCCTSSCCTCCTCCTCICCTCCTCCTYTIQRTVLDVDDPSR